MNERSCRSKPYGSYDGDFRATIVDTTFSSNWCGGKGGGIWTYANGAGAVNISQAVFLNNSVVYRDSLRVGALYGGAIAITGDDVSAFAEDCVFENNTAANNGGAVLVEGGALVATDCSFSGNVGGSGGAVSAGLGDEDSPANVVVRGGSMRRNVAVSYGRYPGYGGAVHAEEGSQVTLSEVLLEKNEAGFGGGVSVATDAVALFEGVAFMANTAEFAGGGLQVWGNGSAVAEDCQFVGNTADGVEGDSSGSGYTSSSASEGSSAVSSTSSYSGPTKDGAGASGGAISVTDEGSLLLLGSIVSGNLADGRGGGVHCGEASNVTVIGVEFDEQASGQRGGRRGHGGACAATDGCWVSRRSGGKGG